MAPGQVADPSSIKRGEEFPKEWAKRQAKLAKMAKDVVRKFNEDSTVAAAAATVEASARKPKKAMAKKPAHKPSASTSMPSRPRSSAML